MNGKESKSGLLHKSECIEDIGVALKPVKVATEECLKLSEVNESNANKGELGFDQIEKLIEMSSQEFEEFLGRIDWNRSEGLGRFCLWVYDIRSFFLITR